LLPLEAEILREAQESLLGEMRRWGYRHVITPLVESMDVLDLGLGTEQRRRLFKFTDVRGDIVALVGERTVPVARLVAGKLRARRVLPRDHGRGQAARRGQGGSPRRSGRPGLRRAGNPPGGHGLEIGGARAATPNPGAARRPGDPRGGRWARAQPTVRDGPGR